MIFYCGICCGNILLPLLYQLMRNNSTVIIKRRFYILSLGHVSCSWVNEILQKIITKSTSPRHTPKWENEANKNKLVPSSRYLEESNAGNISKDHSHGDCLQLLHPSRHQTQTGYQWYQWHKSCDSKFLCLLICSSPQTGLGCTLMLHYIPWNLQYKHRMMLTHFIFLLLLVATFADLTISAQHKYCTVLYYMTMNFETHNKFNVSVMYSAAKSF